MSLPRHALPESEVLGDVPPVRKVAPAEVAERLAGAPRLAVLDDDPTGTQTVKDVPVLTSWTVDDLRWALRQDSPAFFVLTNTRSLSPRDAATRNREVVRALHEASRAEDVPYVVASRGDSTLRGHFPLETDVLAEELASVGAAPDGVVLVPAYIEAGRLTVDSVHWMRTADGLLPVGESEFARDATFGYTSSALPDWVEEKTQGRVPADKVLRITLTDLRTGGPSRVADRLRTLRDGAVAVVDAVCDDDLRVLALALAEAERHGSRLLHRVGPSFVRARAGQPAHPPLTGAELASLRAPAPHGLIVIGSHVSLTTRQLTHLRENTEHLAEYELDVARLLDPTTRDTHVRETADAAAESLRTADTVVRTSRAVVTAADPDESLAISRAVSAALVETVRLITAARRPAYVIAKGGITSSDTATHGLHIRRAWARGTLLPGIVSLWQPTAGPTTGTPYIVFAGNVGTTTALTEAVTLLSPTP
ncbi:four-carbon acid sugar kinase family protein [Streptomyces sp. YU58]|uniref:four-carbon acid sugar kinase family protein n=1 Tax=Streptomyces sp. SX92 TaxID=3158972 RepID=UPI0027BA0A99|nr:four-carbon acid sugar kinase family protein [Streptomyces coralus]WLW54918.1 four-carbon acid sugar kinase family protein [Streptomyces coralus]